MSELCRLDAARAARFMQRQPKRIVLIRHAESIGNVDSSVYAHIPDNKLHITERGKQQAHVSDCNVLQDISHVVTDTGSWTGTEGADRPGICDLLCLSISTVQTNL